MSGAFLMSREIFNHEIWTDVAKFRIFFYIVGNAVWSEKGVTKGGVHIGRGQYLRSYRNMREDLMYMDNNAEKYYSLNTLKKKVDELVEDGSLLTEETKLGTLYTIVNYQHYQAFSAYKAPENDGTENAERTAKEQPQNGERTAREQPQNNKNYDNQDNQDKQVNHKTTTDRQPVLVVDEGYGKLTTFYDNNIGPVNYHIGETLQDWVNDFGSELTLHALEIAVEANAQNKMKYALKILRSWKDQRFKTVADVVAAEERRQRDQSKVRGFPKASGGRSLYDPSPETIERQRRAIENFDRQQITDDSDLPF